MPNTGKHTAVDWVYQRVFGGRATRKAPPKSDRKSGKSDAQEEENTSCGCRPFFAGFRFLRYKRAAANGVLLLAAVVFLACFFFCSTRSGLEKLKSAGAKSVSLYASGGFYAEEGCGSAKFWTLSRGAEGVALRFSASDLSAKEAIIRLSATVLQTETVADGTIYYCRAPGLYRERVLPCGKCNLVVAELSDRVTVGAPVLFCGF